MAGDFIRYQRPDRGRTTGRLQAKGPRWYSWSVPLCISLPVVCGIAFVPIRQTVFTDNPRATSVVENQHEHKQGERDDGCPSVPCPELVVQLPEAQKSGSEMVVPPPEAQKSGSEMVVPPPEAQKSGPEMVPLPEAQKSGPEMVPLPEAQKSGHEPNVGAMGTTEMASLQQFVLPADAAKKVGHKIWINETGGNRDAITSWNANEEFASLGIGHFIWFPAGKTAPFDESFPRMLEFLRQQNVRLPLWLDRTPIPPCPWTSRTDFIKNFKSPQMKQLRQFLLDTVAEQTQFLVMRAQSAIDKILESTPESVERQHITTQFARIAQASKDLYPLIDYINFKGEGTDPAETALDKETGARQGWGLKQVLLKMNGTASEPMAVLSEFADAARFVLLQRIHNIPANRIWEAGWLRRVETYRRPLSDREFRKAG